MRIRTGWRELRVCDFGQLVTGRTPSSAMDGCWGDKTPFVTPGDMVGQKWVENTDRLLSPAGEAAIRSCEVPAGSVSVSCIGWQMGKVVRLRRRSFTNQQLNTIVVEGDNCADFLFYALLPRQNELKTLGSGGTRTPILNKGNFGKVKILTPPLPTQRRIASILSAYDDLIENNTKRIEILEEMARSLYREWFVHFRFPGHEKVKLVDSELGKIPEGWTARNIGSITENYDRRRKPLSSLQRAKMQGPFPYYGAAKIFDHIDDYIFDGRYLLMAEDGSVVTKDRRPVLQIATGKFWVNNHTHVLRGLGEYSTDFVFLTLDQIDITPYITGAAQPKINQANMNRIPVLAPTGPILSAFDSHIGPMLAQLDLLSAKNAILRQTRDLLLPKLISGAIDVDALDLPEAG